MTWYDVSFLVYYDGSTAVAVGDARQDWFVETNTGWYLEYANAFKYADPPPYSIEQKAEGWGGFNGIGGLYPHEHRMIITATAVGGCYVTDYFWGTLPNLAYYTVYAWIG